ncbi:uncharacterized protein [Dermacentor andersoni]|uniref:uncharacterized protein isoform X3 n=1 Tax=Dermacentor andersoni TaxID=34620 RepID=UPI00241710DD|nr:uncharacterized protein LOC126533058 isoform X3 [Dermacentor andersoni]
MTLRARGPLGNVYRLRRSPPKDTHRPIPGAQLAETSLRRVQVTEEGPDQHSYRWPMVAGFSAVSYAPARPTAGPTRAEGPSPRGPQSTGGVAGGGARPEQTTSPSTMAGHYRRLEAAIADALLAPSCRPFKTAGVRHERNVKFYTGWSPWVYSNFLSPNELHDSGYHSLSRKPFGETPTKAPQAGSRREEVAGIRQRFPSKIPVIVERYAKERNLPLLDKTKFLVPEELTMSQFMSIVSGSASPWTSGLQSKRSLQIQLNGMSIV